ncbi:MAG: hypothetical protein KTV16_04585 [Acidimicrobiia bacterium]|nr:hypothetical protein [Acidimicrobiia bacterium]
MTDEPTTDEPTTDEPTTDQTGRAGREGQAEDPDRARPHRPATFVAKSGFMRAGAARRQVPTVAQGPVWSYEESDRRAHEFLMAVAGSRDIYEYIEDPVEHARVNSMMLLFNDEVSEAFETLLARMPEPRAVAWRDLISGGVSAEVFGPLTLQEQLDERRIGQNLRAARNGRIVSALVTAVVLAALGLGVVALWTALVEGDEPGSGRLDFGLLSGVSNEAALIGGPPAVEGSLVAPLSTTVALLAGDGPATERITDAPPGSLPHPPGAVQATVFQYAGSGHVLFAGPAGFVEDSCLRASVVTGDLRPLDVVTTGPCEDPVGRPATVGCVGPTAVLVDLKVPSGVVELPEGGSGFAEEVRVQLVGHDPRYETLSLRATIGVGSRDEVVVPRFGAAPGEVLQFDFGSGRVGACTVTGDLPR